MKETIQRASWGTPIDGLKNTNSLFPATVPNAALDNVLLGSSTVRHATRYEGRALSGEYMIYPPVN
jgi:hypothetical protein